MSGLLGGAPVTPEEQRRNNGHRHGWVLAVLGVLFVYLYCFTHIDRRLGLPAPQDLAERMGIRVDHVFDSDRNVDSEIHVSYNAETYSNDDERMVLFLGVGVAFVLVYYLPVAWKRQALLAVTVVLAVVLYGWAGIALFVAAHMGVYLILHPGLGPRPGYAALAGFLAGSAMVSKSGGMLAVMYGTLWAAMGAAFYRFAVLPGLGVPRLASVLRVVAVQSAMIVVFAGAILNGLGGGEWSLPLGVMLFFWNWERLMMYHIDHQDGLVPEDIPLDRYLGVFLSPGTIPNWNWGVTIGQGYAYVENNFLAEDKNHLIRKGLQLYGVALVYIVFGDWGHEWLVKFLRSQDLYVFHRVKNLSRYFANGGEVSTPTVLLTTFIDVFRWMVLWGGVVHFKVGTWLVCGYKCDPYFNRPWMATNLVTLWSRFTFHYREFLVRAFYYPAFFAMPKVARSVRIVLSTLAAATFGNFVWGHMSEAFFYKRIRFESLLDILPTWPYFVLIGVGISVSELWLLRKKRLRRKPWTMDKWLPLDVLAAYGTLQFYGLIHVFFYRHDGGSTWNDTRLFLIGFGIHL